MQLRPERQPRNNRRDGGEYPSGIGGSSGTHPVVIAGFVFVLIPTTGEFITPLLVGGPSSYMFGNSIQQFFGESSNWNYGSVLALWLVAVVVVMLLVFGRFLNTDLRETPR